jgi:hypothetical protein
MSSSSELDTGLLDFLVGEEPDERFIAEHTSGFEALKGDRGLSARGRANRRW